MHLAALALTVVACHSNGQGAGDAGETSSALAACRAEAARAATLCGSSERGCFFEKYAARCTEERAEAITASLRCFATTTCHTFADPGETAVDECLVESYAQHLTPAAKKARAAFCSTCECPADGAEVLPFTHFDDTTNTRLLGCFEKATTCGTAERCLYAEMPEAAACFPEP